MKKFLITTLVAIMALMSHAQDVIVKKDGSTILSSVIEVSDTEIKYKKHSNPKGPTYTIKVSELISINYQNGEKDTFNLSSSGTNPVSNDSPTTVTVVESQVNSQPQYANQQISYQQTQQQQISGQQQMLGQSMYNNQSVYNGQSMYNGQMMNNPQNSKKIDLERREKKGKSLKWWGFGTGMVVAFVGAGFVADAYDDSAFITGMSMWGVGMAGGLTCFFVGNGIAKRAKRELNQLQYSSMYQYEIPIGKKNSIATNVDLVKNNLNNQKTLALGVSYRF